jgi:hypothetical protein
MNSSDGGNQPIEKTVSSVCFDIIAYQPQDEDRWDSFVWKGSKNGTLFHAQRFLRYHSPDRFKDHSLLFFRQNELLAIFSAADWVDKSTGKRILRSHPGASYGGFVLHRDCGIEDAYALVAHLKEYAIREKFEGIEMRLAENIFNIKPADELEFALINNGFTVKSFELSSAISLMEFRRSSDIGAEIERRFTDGGRRALRKARKNSVEVIQAQSEKEFADFWNILAENLKKHSATPTHSLEEILRLKNFYPERIQLFYAKYQNRMIAGMVVFVCNTSAVHTMYFGSDKDFQSVRPLNIVMFDVLNKITRLGFNYLNLGISTENGGEIINWGLFRFKENFDAGGSIRKSFYCPLA